MKRRKVLLMGGVGLVVLVFLLKEILQNVIGQGGGIALSVEHNEAREVEHDYDPALVAITRDPCRYQAPFFSGGSSAGEVHLVFYGKPIMQALKHLCVLRDWKMTLILNASEKGVKMLDRIASAPNVFTIVYTTSRSLHHPIVRRLANSTHALVSAIRYSFKITGAKKTQLESFRAYFQKFGCNMKDKHMMPLSFMLDDSKECLQFFKYASLNLDTWWVLKTSQGYGGDGISIHSNLSVLHKKFALCNNHEQFIVQKYLPRLMLIEGKKFDVRGLVVIANTNPYMVFYHEGYLRRSLQKFSSGNGRGIHLTNSHIQTQSRMFSPDKHFWSFRRLQSYLDEHQPDNRNFVAERLVPFIKKVALFILQAGTSICVPYDMLFLSGKYFFCHFCHQLSVTKINLTTI